MPIYAYRCEACGFEKDVLQKLSDAPLKDCLSCGKASFSKQVTAAGFQLKGGGWYATDFRGGSSSQAKDSENACAAASVPESGTACGSPACGATSTGTQSE